MVYCSSLLSRLPPAAWQVAAIAQSLFWFFAIPHLLRPYWGLFWAQVLESYGTTGREVLLNLMGAPLYIIYPLLVLPIYRAKDPFFEQFKISEKPWAWQSPKPEVREEFVRRSYKSVQYFLINYFGVVTFLSMMKKYSPSPPVSFSDDDWPTTLENAGQLLVILLFHELGFYWTHRIMHWPSLYRFHKVHHEYKDNNVLASTHNHWVDFVVSIAGPSIFSVSFTNPHSITLFMFLQYTIFANLDDHVGYSFPWSPVRWFPGSNRTEKHEFHHVVNMGSFASKINIYDKMFKSEDNYLSWKEKREEKRAKAQ